VYYVFFTSPEAFPSNNLTKQLTVAMTVAK